MKKLLIFILTAAFSLQALATNENALRILDETNSVLSPKQNAITLEQAKELAVGENIDVRIAYERLFQAQRKIGQARANYFPYGVGDALMIYYTNAFSVLILVELATSLPSKWYHVQKQKDLRTAEAFNLKALRENIKNQVAQMYYTIIKEESLMKVTAYELKLMEDLAIAREAEVAIGLADASELENLKYRTLSLRDEFLRFESYLEEEKAAYKMLLNLPYTAEVNLQPVGQFLAQEDFKVDVESLANMAQERSYEVKSAQSMINAAYDSRNSQRWSILSFSGIGFGYLAGVRLEGSKVNQSIIMKKAVSENVYTNTYTREGMFRNSVDFFLSEKQIADKTKFYMARKLELFNVGEVALSELIESELYYLRDYREMIMAHYNALTRLDDLERVVLGTVNKTAYQAEEFEVVAFAENRRKTTISLSSDVNMYDIQSVTYTVDGNYVGDFKAFNAKRSFKITLKNKYLTFPIKGSAQIILDNGEVINKNFELDL